MRAARWALAAAALLLAVPCAAQHRRVLAGVVVDSSTGAPLPRVLVRAPSAHPVLSDDSGRFTVAGTFGPADTLWAFRLGYDTAFAAVPAGRSAALTLRLRPDPVVLQAVTAFGTAGSLRQTMIIRDGFYEGDMTSPIPASLLVEQRTDLRRVPCRPGTEEARRNLYCAWIRGEPEAVVLFVDDQRMRGGLDDLATFPAFDVAFIERSSSGGVIRAYTNEYVERMAHVGYTFPPPPGW